MPTSQKVSALLVVLVAVAGAVYTAVAGNQPLLGLDLQGGVSVVLQPTTDADEEALNQSVEIIRSRVDALGVAEPEISRQGDTILVDLPGVKEQQRALELVGQTAELRFRPILFDLGPAELFDEIAEQAEQTEQTDGESSPDETTTDDGPADDESTTTTGADDDSTTTTVADDGSAGDDEGALGLSGRFGAALPQQDSTTTTGADSEADDTSTTAADDADGSTTTTTTAAADSQEAGEDADAEDAGEGAGAEEEAPPVSPAMEAALEVCSSGQLTAPEDDAADQPVVLDDRDGNRLCLGPTLLTGEALDTAGANLEVTGEWSVSPVFKDGPDGIDAFNEAALTCWADAPNPEICPTARLAIVLDHEVVSAPVIRQPTFTRDQIQISGSFDEESAENLAAILRFGALPVELEPQQTRTVSATIGDDVLQAGVIAGLIGLGLVALYLLAYYRLAGLVAIGGLMLSAALLWSIVAWFGENLGLALSLAGVVGLIVAIGVSADSNIVYFENVKDAYRGGRRVPTAVERAYEFAISTIIKADVVSLIAAALLYWLTVGAVRGFAFYLGLATLLDLVISWLFMRPALGFLARRRAVNERPSWLGLPTGETT